MRAMHYRNVGGPDQIVAVDIPIPRPTATQVLVKVVASSVKSGGLETAPYAVLLLPTGVLSLHTRCGYGRRSG